MFKENWISELTIQDLLSLHLKLDFGVVENNNVGGVKTMQQKNDDGAGGDDGDQFKPKGQH
ncbi:hypothetical protein BLOT_005281 [Blomia tropicalis]|nr:hypothetical protein BLOT_005281 [Blomia tropicalis]